MLLWRGILQFICLSSKHIPRLNVWLYIIFDDLV